MSKQTLQDPEIIERFAEWYARCLVRIERDRVRKTREAADDAGKRTA